MSDLTDVIGIGFFFVWLIVAAAAWGIMDRLDDILKELRRS